MTLSGIIKLWEGTSLQQTFNYEIQWKALKERKDEDDPDVPKITKSLLIIKWVEVFQDFLNNVIVARMIPLAYVI